MRAVEYTMLRDRGGTLLDGSRQDIQCYWLTSVSLLEKARRLRDDGDHPGKMPRCYVSNGGCVKSWHLAATDGNSNATSMSN